MVDNFQHQNEANSKASGLTPPRWLCRRCRIAEVQIRSAIAIDTGTGRMRSTYQTNKRWSSMARSDNGRVSHS